MNLMAFESDNIYRHSVITKLSKSSNWTDTERSIALATKYDMNPAEVSLDAILKKY